jgi:hypothetical protein
MTNDIIPTNTLPEPIPANAILIRPQKGAKKALQAVKQDLKSYGCHWHTAGGWSCPIRARRSIEMMLAKEKIGFEIMEIKDDYFEKNRNGREAVNLWTQIDIKEQQHYKESMALLVERDTLTKEIAKSGESPASQGKLQRLDERDKTQQELQEEIDQMRNSVRLLEKAEEKARLPFHVMGYNTQSDILIWKDGRVIALPVTKLNKDQLRLYVGGASDWFDSKESVRELKELTIDTAHRLGFIDDESPLRSGVWRMGGRWIVISGKNAMVIVNGAPSRLSEPLFEGKLVETAGAEWLDWEVFEESIKIDGLKDVFKPIYEKVRQWNWVVPSMAAFITAFVMLSIVQQAMKWRPWIYITGAKSTGKSTFFEEILQLIFGSQVERLDKSTAHATAQTIGNSGRIPIFDEFEKHKHIPDILELAKLFNRGGQKTSGTGADKAHRYNLHHMPFFGSIYLPKRVMQDSAQESRIIKFELNKIPKGSPPLEKFSADEGKVLAARIVAAMIRSWDSIEMRTKAILADQERLFKAYQGIEIRTLENFMYASALLDLVALEGLEETLPMWLSMQQEDDGDKLLDTILASHVFVEKEKKSVREMLYNVHHEEVLERHGLKVALHESKRYLALRCEDITRHLLKDTEYGSLDIKWPLSRIDGALNSRQVKMAGTNQRCILIPLEKAEGV